MQQVYGIDLGDTDLLRHRSWRWLRNRILGLLSVPPVWLVVGDRLVTVPQTRIAYKLHPPGKE